MWGRYYYYKLGDFLIYNGVVSEFTSVPLEFQILNIPWNNDLSNPQSALFQQYASGFCAEVWVNVIYV